MKGSGSVIGLSSWRDTFPHVECQGSITHRSVNHYFDKANKCPFVFTQYLTSISNVSNFDSWSLYDYSNMTEKAQLTPVGGILIYRVRQKNAYTI
jgi:hypothetical protein